MRILILIRFFPPKWNAGKENATYNIAKYLACLGHEVHVITSKSDQLSKDEFNEGFYIHRIEMKKGICNQLRLNIEMNYLIKKINPDIIHIQSVNLFFGGYIHKLFNKKPIIFYGRGSEIYLDWKFKKTILKFILKNSTKVIALTNDMKNQIDKIYKRDIIIIPNGVDLNKFKYSREENNHNSSNIVISVGNLRPVKGIEYLIHSINLVKETLPDIQLLIVGSGHEYERLMKQITDYKLKDNIYLLGNVENKKISEYMNIADLFALPSISEGFPLVILEAMACGLPIVASDVGGIKEVVKNNVNGLLIEPRDISGLANSIIKLLDDDQRRSEMSRINRKDAERFSWNNIVLDLEKVYKDAISEFDTAK